MNQKRPEILTKIITSAKESTAKNQRLLAIFDLDSTLFDVSHRIAVILQEFAHHPEMRQRFPQETKLMEKIKNDSKAYGIKSSLVAAGITDPDPTFKTTVIDFWKKHFFADSHLKYDQPYTGSVEFVQELHSVGAEIAYLTGRDVPRMLQGTIESLKQWGFPVNDQLLIFSPPATPSKLHTQRMEGAPGVLYLKPQSSMDDTIFKKDFFIRVDATPGPVWFFENEPANIHLVLEHCPHIQIVYVDTVHSGAKPPPGPQIPRITSFIEG